MVLADREAVLGPEHPQTLQTAYRLAMVLSDLGREVQARRMLGSVLAARERVLGPDHRTPSRPGRRWPTSGR